MASLAPDRPIERMRAAAGDALLTGQAERALFACDVFADGAMPLAVLRPRSVEQLQRGIAAATAEGIAVVPRGGGMSYTGGYLLDRPALLVDTASLDRIVDINSADMTVTVEAGVTWKALHETLAPLGLRAKAWGTLSGSRATVGGGMSQNGFFWGGRGGGIASGALSFDVVLSDGRLVGTGSDFFRPYGPDLTGLFAADCGALGVKARVTLQLVRDGPAFAYGSFAFDRAEDFFAAMSRIAREELASESFGFDPFLQSQRMKRDSLASDAKSLLTMMKKQGGVLKSLKEGARVVAAGRRFLDGATFSLHTIAEGRRQDIVDGDMREIEAIARAAGGRPVENTIPKILRANPFPPVNSMVGPSGERWVPVHGFLPHSKLVEAWQAIEALYAANREEMAAHGVEAGAMLAAVSPSACLIEPVFFWPDALNALHRHAVESAHLARLDGFPEDRAARALVQRLRQEIVALFASRDAIHLQVARTYPLRQSHDPAAWDVLVAIKAKLDPANLMNPGSLGL